MSRNFPGAQQIYTVSHKTCHFVFDYNSSVSRSVFIYFLYQWKQYLFLFSVVKSIFKTRKQSGSWCISLNRWLFIERAMIYDMIRDSDVLIAIATPLYPYSYFSTFKLVQIFQFSDCGPGHRYVYAYVIFDIKSNFESISVLTVTVSRPPTMSLLLPTLLHLQTHNANAQACLGGVWGPALKLPWSQWPQNICKMQKMG